MGHKTLTQSINQHSPKNFLVNCWVTVSRSQVKLKMAMQQLHDYVLFLSLWGFHDL